MKKIYLSFSIIITAFSASAQLSLTKAFNEPIIGDVDSRESYDSVIALTNTMGANKLWDFSSLISSSVTSVGTYTTVSSTPNGSNFPSATLAKDDGLGGYTYSKATATQYEIVGIDQPNLVLNFSNTAIASVWPINMGYTNTDLFSGTAVANTTLTGTANGTVTTLGSGTGTLIIPGGASFTNILQVKSKQVINVNLLFGFVTATLTVVNYDYYHSSQKFPLLTVSYTDAQGAFANTSASIDVNTNVITGINDVNFDATFAIYPNPAKDAVSIKLQNSKNENCKVEIINCLGEVSEIYNFGNSTDIVNSISIEKLTPGIYYVKTTLGKKTSIRKLIKD